MKIMNKRETNFNYIPSIDGLRAFAVIMVVLYHLNIPFSKGGYLGVTMFFVISGYLITDILLNNLENDHSIDFKNFYIRRAKRLLPAAVLVIISTISIVTLFRSDLLWRVKEDCLPALFYFSNWWNIFHNVSYFEACSTPSLFLHFWSLSVEEQFYIFWPIIVFIVMKFSKRVKVLCAITVILIIISAMEMFVLYNPYVDPSRVYFGTDTRIFSILIGSIMAMIIPIRKIATKKFCNLLVIGILNLIGFLSFAIIIIMLIKLNESKSFTYQGGMFIFSLLCAILLAICVQPQTVFSKIFAFWPLSKLGKISYGIYLWQYPVIILTYPTVNTGSINIPLCIGLFALVVVLAALSYHFVEHPLRYESFKDLIHKKTHPIKKIFAAILVAPIIISLYGFSIKHDNKEHIKNHIESTLDMNSSLPTTSLEVQQAPSSLIPATVEISSPSGTSQLGTSLQSDTVSSDVELTAIGDSIMIDMLFDLKEYFPKAYVDGRVARKLWQVVYPYDNHESDLTSITSKTNIGKIVVIALSSNGVVLQSEIDSAMSQIGPDHNYVFCNTRVPNSWQDSNNALINSLPEKYPNVRVVDWYSISANHDEYFIKDAVHLTSQGAQVYAAAIASVIKDAGWD